VVCELIAFTSVYLVINGKVNTKRKELKDINVEIERLEVEVRDVKRLESEAATLEKKLQIIDQLMFSRIMWSKFLSEFNSTVPESMWITSFTISAQPATAGGKRILILSGNVLNSPTEKAVNLVGVFMNNIRNNPYLSNLLENPELLGTTSEITGDQQVLRFNMSITFK